MPGFQKQVIFAIEHEAKLKEFGITIELLMVLGEKRVDLVENTVDIENISYEKEGEDIDESEELIEDLVKAKI
ncbi:hypothetical protein AVEN_194536-1 [Araneus ventricosus]|uniref:Uncharacterized protein n=1 Tax=Araneus ventricosus TaxID=182803 RepID=A0A4Y2A6G7_ARAVE|nr:hypothetical protein AVEN_194536-1 [Araneus ventricosus]